jgi:hypothetical protein
MMKRQKIGWANGLVLEKGAVEIIRQTLQTRKVGVAKYVTTRFNKFEIDPTIKLTFANRLIWSI